MNWEYQTRICTEIIIVKVDSLEVVDYLCGFLLFVLVYLTAVGFAIEHLMLGLEAVVLFVGW